MQWTSGLVLTELIELPWMLPLLSLAFLFAWVRGLGLSGSAAVWSPSLLALILLLPLLHLLRLRFLVYCLTALHRAQYGQDLVRRLRCLPRWQETP